MTSLLIQTTRCKVHLPRLLLQMDEVGERVSSKGRLDLIYIIYVNNYVIKLPEGSEDPTIPLEDITLSSEVV